MRVAVVAAAALVVAVFIVLAWPDGGASPHAGVPSAAALATLAASASTGAPAPSAGVAAASSAGRPLVALASGAPGSPPGEVEVCGVGPVRTDSPLPPDLDAPWAAKAEAAKQRLIAALRNESDERPHVAGLLLQRRFDMDSGGRAEKEAAADRCGADKACLENIVTVRVESMARAAVASTEAIARIASATRDPQVYAVAFEACGPIGVAVVAAPSCQLISAEQWARIDAANAIPWLHVATAAAARKDGAAVDEAMHRVANAKESRLYATALLVAAIEHVPAEADGLEQTHMLQFVVSAGIAAWTLPSYQTLTRYCAAPALQDSNRWQACDAVARGLVEHPSTMIERQIGVRIGEGLMWPADRMAALREESDALARAQEDVLSDPQPLSCRAVARARGYLLQVARIGEVGAALAAVKASGKTRAMLAAETRLQREAVAKTEAAARAASAASGG